MTQKRILYGVLTIACFILFYSIIPLDIYDSFFYFLIIVGGVLTAVCSGALLFTFQPVEEEGKESNFGCLIVAVLLVVFFASSFLFLFHEGEREEEELIKNGEFTEATIADGSSFSTRKADFTHLTLEFTTTKGQKIRTNYSIGKEEFDKFYQEQKIPILYSPNYPQILKIIRSEADIREYMKKKSNREN